MANGNDVPNAANLSDAAAAPVEDPAGSGAMDIIATVSHELRSPLTSIKGYTALLLNRWDRLDDARKREMLAQVQTDADRVTRLITELLDISRLETGRLALRRELVDLSALAGSVVRTVAMSYPSLGAELAFPDDLPSVWADPDKVQQVLTNLVENAAKYADPTCLKLTGRVVDDEVVVSVADRGPGIPPAELPRVFERFFQHDHGRPSGTGLGLWISRGLIEAHGGELRVDSVVDEGSTFSFSLPLGAFEALHGAG